MISEDRAERDALCQPGEVRDAGPVAWQYRETSAFYHEVDPAFWANRAEIRKHSDYSLATSVSIAYLPGCAVIIAPEPDRALLANTRSQCVRARRIGATFALTRGAIHAIMRHEFQ